jgi:hypothetical protein
MKDNVILVDADGVLFDWVYSFTNWMLRHGMEKKNPDQYVVSDMYGLSRAEGKRYARMFNESAWIRKLPPYKDAIKYVKKLHEEHGYVFHVISSLSDDEYSQHLRTKNLREMFGNSVFEKFIYLDTGADKDKVLSEYYGTGCYWVEDKVENAEVGLSMHLESIVMRNKFNKDEVEDSGALIADNWKDIYDIITGGY